MCPSQSCTVLCRIRLVNCAVLLLDFVDTGLVGSTVSPAASASVVDQTFQVARPSYTASIHAPGLLVLISCTVRAYVSRSVCNSRLLRRVWRSLLPVPGLHLATECPVAEVANVACGYPCEFGLHWNSGPRIARSETEEMRDP